MLFSAALRVKARAALKTHWQTALLIALIVNLPSLLVQGAAAFTNSDLLTRLQELAYQASLSAEAISAFPDSVKALLAESGVLTMTGLGVLAWLVTPTLSLGMNHWILERIRGAELPVSAVFSRLRIFMKSIGLRLFILLKMLIWILPGLAVSFAAIIPLLNADPSVSESLVSAANTSVLLIYLGMAVMLVLGIMGYLYYALADFILADEPDERVLSCAHRSKTLMKGRRSMLFMLLTSFILWYLMIDLFSSFIAGIAGSVIGLVLQMLGGLFLTVYILTTMGVFYESLRLALAPDLTAESPEDLPE